MRKKYFLFILLAFFTFLGFAQKASLKGTVKDDKTGELLLGTSVILEGTTIGAMTDFDGNYLVQGIPEGTYNVVCKFISYETIIKKDVTFATGEEKVVDFSLGESVVEVGEVNVIGRKNRETENMLLMEQKEASVMTETVGAMELARKGASDVAAGVKKVAGISMMGSKQLFVRGLGDRFNSAQLNGLPIASPDPIKKVVKLDFFPSDIVKVLNVSKAYSALNYADYTGALINVETKDYPNDAFFSIDFGTAYNSNSTFNEFRQMESDGFNFMGLDVASRKKLTPTEYLTVNRLMDIGSDFNYQSYGFTRNNAMPSIDISLKGGQVFELNSQEKIGYLASVSFSNEYEYRPDVLDVTYNKQKNSDGDFINQEYSYNSYLSALISASYNKENKMNLKYNFIFLNNGEDAFKEKQGYKRDWGEENLALVRNAQYINYKLINNQLNGKHYLNDRFEVDWRAGFMNVYYDVPDRREIIFQQNDAAEWLFFTLNNGNDTKRVILEQDAYEANVFGSVSYKLNDEKGKVTGGIASRYKNQDYNSFFFGYDFETLPVRSAVVDPLNPNLVLNDELIDEIDANTSDDMGYGGWLFINSAFIDFEYKISDQLLLNAGVRTEVSQMNLISNTNKIDNDEVDYRFDNFDFFPALNMKYTVSDKSNVRLSMSRTVTRPSFFEKSPARMIPEAGQKQIRGNQGTKENPLADGTYLENSYSNNVDVKYEIYPDNGELISLGVYYKNIIEPIEKVSLLMGGSDIIYTYRNFIDNATAAGAEFEIKKKFGNVFTGLNAAYIYTHIDVPEDAPEINTERALQGASPYLINADLGYNMRYGSSKENTFYAGMVYNVYGKRIYAVGVSGAGNQYELPTHSLDLVIKNKINSKWGMGLSVKNILNSEVKFVQDVYTDLSDQDKITEVAPFNTYKRGISAKISIGYKF